MPQAHKGDRVYTPARLDAELSQLLRAEAQRRHMAAGDLIAIAVGDYYGRPDLAPPLRDEKELPLTG